MIKAPTAHDFEYYQMYIKYVIIFTLIIFEILKKREKKLRRKIWEISSFIFRSALLTFVKVIISKKPKKTFIYFSPCYRNVIITVYTQYGWFLLRERERRDKLILSMDKNLLTLCKSNIIFLNPCLSSLDKLETSPTDKNQVLYSNKK